MLRTSLCSLLASFAFAGVLFSADITPDEAASHNGDTVTVRGTVSQVIVSKLGNAFVNFGGAYPNEKFSAVVMGKRTPALMEGGKTWLTDLQGKEAAVTGKVELHDGKPQIVLNAKEDIKASGSK